jgi:hypothetical protein
MAMQPSTAFIPVTTALVVLAFLASADLELLRPLPHFAGRESAPVVPTVPTTPPLNQGLENRRLHEATDCIDRVTSTNASDFATCLQIYAADFPRGPSYTFLYQRRDSRISLIAQAAARAALWKQLSDVVAEDERASTPRADHAVRDAFSQVKAIAGTASAEQRQFMERAEPFARAFDDSETRRGDLRAAAQHWGTRSGIDYENYSKARDAITAYDRKSFDYEDQAAWDKLAAADTLIAWSKTEITAANRAQLPIALVKRNAADTDYGLVRDITDDLAAAGFGSPVKNVEDAAVLIELSDIRRHDADSGKQTRKHTGYDEEMYDVKFGFGLRLVWIGARGLPPEKIADPETDTMKEATAVAVEKTAAAAVASFDRFTRRPPSER